MSAKNKHVNEIFQPLLNSLLPEVENEKQICPECGGKLHPVYGFCTECDYVDNLML